MAQCEHAKQPCGDDKSANRTKNNLAALQRIGCSIPTHDKGDGKE